MEVRELNKEINLYRITADYRPTNPDKPHYYVYGRTEKEARKRFYDIMSFLKLYEIERLDAATAQTILAEPMKHSII